VPAAEQLARMRTPRRSSSRLRAPEDVIATAQRCNLLFTSAVLVIVDGALYSETQRPGVRKRASMKAQP